MKRKGEIKITCTGARLVPIGELKPLQGALKTLPEESYERLKAAILDVGFSFPELVWSPKAVKSKTRYYIVDGHQRVTAIRRMIKEGYALPGGKLPVSFTEARNRKEALKKIALATSQYGKYDTATFKTFLVTAGIDYRSLSDEIDLPQLDMGEFSKEWDGGDAAPSTKGGVDGSQNLDEMGYKIVLTCKDEEQQRKLLDEFEDRGIECQVLIL